MATRSLSAVLFVLACNLFLVQGQVVITTSDCNTAKQCIQKPPGCSQETCNFLVTYHLDRDHVHFELSGKLLETTGKPYVALGLADAPKMQGAYTIGCNRNGNNVEIKEGETPASGRGHEFIPESGGIGNFAGSFDPVTEVLSCRFTKTRDPGTNTDVKDLRGSKQYFIIMAHSGDTGTTGYTKHKDEDVHEEKIDFTFKETQTTPAQPTTAGATGTPGTSTDDTTDTTTNSSSFMVITWLTFATVCILLGMRK